MDGDAQYSYQQSDEAMLRVRDLEEKQKILKDRLLLIGQNLIDTKEKTSQDIIEIKKNIEILKQNIDRMRDFIETLSSEVSRFAKKEDIEILSKQIKMLK